MGLKEKEDGTGSCSPSGLALLLSGGTAETRLPDVSQDDDEAAAAAHVFGLHDAVKSGDGMFASVSEIVSQRAQEDRAGPTNAADNRPGRLGPATVEVDYIVGHLETNATGTIVSTANFSSCRANVCVFSGKWQYETTICSAGIMQIGWATLQCPFTSEEGVGDAPDSYAFDGKRVRKWHVNCTQYGEAWAAGDVIGCCLDLDRGEATYYRNGRSLGVAFTGIRTMQPTLAYFPAVSLSYAERCELNFGAQPLLYPAPGYQPMQATSPPWMISSASYLVSCLERLVTTVRPRMLYGADAGAEGSMGVVASSAAAPSSSSSGDARSGGVGGGSVFMPTRTSSRPSFVVPWESWLLLGNIAVDELAPHLLDAHIVAGVLMPAMLRLCSGGGSTGGSGAGGAVAAAATVGYLGSAASAAVGASAAAGATMSPLSGLLQLFELCLEPEMLSAVINCLLETLSRRCISAALVPEQFPYSASCPFLGLAVAIASRTSLRSVWLRHPNLWQVLEGFLTRKGPSPDDLRQLLPHVWWRGCSELSGDRDRMRGALQALSTAITRVEDRQYELLCCLLGSPGAGDPREDALVEFLRYLVHKNRGATRDIPPPGLSDSTVLISAYFVLVRMLRVALPLTSGFPAAALFVKTAMKADLEPVNSLARLGGIVTHLCRESPVTSQAELAPLAVAPPPRSSQSGVGASATSVASGSGASPGIPGASGAQSFPSTSAQLAPPPALEADSWVVARVRARPRLAADLVDLAMTLYAFKVGGSIKMTHGLSNTVAGSLAGLEEVERHLRRVMAAGGSQGATAAGPATASYANYLRDTRDVFRQEVSNNIRLSSLLKVVFFSGWKQEACLSLAGWLSRMLTAAAALPGPLLSYVPTCYLDCILDTVTSVRHATEAVSGTTLPPAAQAPSVAALRHHGSLGDIVAVLVILLHEPRICTPDTKEALVGVLAALLDQPGMLTEVESNDVARQRLVGAAVAAFDSRLWHPVSQVLLRLVRGQGFGEQQQQQQAGGRGGAVMGGSPLFRGLMVAELRPDRPALQPFLHRLFNMVNWSTSEFAATVADLHENRSRRHMTEQQQQFRKAGIMFELVSGLLRLLEFTASSIPEAYLAPGAHAVLNLNRLLEVVSFVLSHFTEGSDARRLSELLTVPAPDSAGGPPTMSSTVRIERTLLSEKINRAHILAPVVGSLLGLWRGSGGGHPAGSTAGMEVEPSNWSRADSGGTSGGSGDGSWAESPGSRASARNVLLDALLRHWDSHTEKQMGYLRAVDWRGSLPGAEPAVLDAGAREFSELLLAAVARRKQLAAIGEGSEGGGSEDVPEELLDPITTTLMTDPVILPDSQMTVDRATIERHFLNSQTDPFSRTPLTREALRPNEEIKRKIHEWRKTRGRG